ncbi:MAG: HNH endonuclease [Rhodobacteraceae bacterium]|nr:HNH endonuclease [Paracoccaceae bacterium]
MTPRPSIPSNIAHNLRAEVGFGCAVCGNPIVEYHHIIPWEERHHYEADHMVVLCRNHHAELGKQNRKLAYKAKQNPINIRQKRFKGYLVTNKENQNLILGNARFVGVTTAVSYFGIPLFGHSVVGSEIQVNCFIPDDQFFPELEIRRNHVAAMIDGFWDIEFKSNFIKFRKRKGSVFLSLDFRREDVEIRGRFIIDGKNFVFSPNRCDFGGARFENLTLQGNVGQAAIRHGRSDIRLLRENYAMANPVPKFVRV